MDAFQTSPASSRVLRALARARRSMAPVIRSRTDPSTGRPFAALTDIQEIAGPALTGAGLEAQPVILQDQDRHGAAIRFYHTRSMEWIEFRCWFPLPPTPAMAEVLGAITCARRAIYLTALDIRMADDPVQAVGAASLQDRCTMPTTSQIGRAKALDAEIRLRLGEDGAKSFLQSRLGTRFLSQADSGTLESYIRQAEGLLDTILAPAPSPAAN